MATATRETLTQYALDTYGLGRRGTNSGASAAAVTDAVRFEGARAAERIEAGCALRITSGLRAGDVTFLSTKPRLTTGVMNVNPSFGGVLDGTSNFQILYSPLRFDGAGGLHDAINQAIGEFAWEKRIVPITEINDGDMLAAGTAAWSGAGGAALSKVAASFTAPWRYLQLAGAAAGQNVQSNTIPVEPGGNYYIECIAQRAAAGGNGTLSLQDITNSTTIALTQTAISQMEPQILWNPSNVMTTTTHQVALRVTKADGAGNNIGVDTLILRKNWLRRFVVQDRPTRVLRLGRLLAVRAIPTKWEFRTERDMREIPATVQQLDAGLWEFDTQYYTGALSLWYEEFVAPALLNADSDTTAIPKEDLAPVAVEILLRPLQKDTRWADIYSRVLREAVRVREDYQERMTQVSESPWRVVMAHV